MAETPEKWEAPARGQKILLLLSTDADTVEWCRIAEAYTKTLFSDVQAVYWEVGTPFPDEVEQWEGDWILSFRGDLIVPERVYSRARKGAINIHPSPPWFRGLGGQYYAIYERHERYGSTCHHMAKSVDSGDIIDVRYFPIAPGETVTSLRHHVGAVSLVQYLDLVANYIALDKPLPKSDEQWGDRLYTSAQLRTWLAEKRVSDPENNCFK
ncbi:formyltransferase family protein [Micromonospora sp. NPDC049559]|uniref:formyltransferase family protein n=1 Tax=Micromonospora sp. NPDC049559 TaxID=3155923 RepID=UPI0034153E26